jgi:hypothetical protein
VERYQETGDPSLLTLIARWPSAIQEVDVDWLLGRLEEVYWRMRVLEGLILADDRRAARYVSSHPREFAYAVGRVRAVQYGPSVRALVQGAARDWDLLSLITWTLGRVGDREGIVEVRRIITEVVARPD